MTALLNALLSLQPAAKWVSRMLHKPSRVPIQALVNLSKPAAGSRSDSDAEDDNRKRRRTSKREKKKKKHKHEKKRKEKKEEKDKEATPQVWHALKITYV